MRKKMKKVKTKETLFCVHASVKNNGEGVLLKYVTHSNLNLLSLTYNYY
jgi:hypothetical protein